MWKLGVFPVLFLGKSTFKQNLSALGAVRVEFFSNQKTRTGGARGQLREKSRAKQNPRGKGDEVVVQGERDIKYDW